MGDALRAHANSAEAPAELRVLLFGEVDVEGQDVDPTVRLRPLSRSLLARLTLGGPGERLDTQDLARELVMKLPPGVPVAPDKLSSAQQQLRNAQWELRKRLGDGRGAAQLLGAGRRWVALDGVSTDHQEFLDAAADGDCERARAIAARGEFLAGVEDDWAAPHRRSVQQRLQALGPPADVLAPPRKRSRRSRALVLAAVAVTLAVAGTAIGVSALTGTPAPLPDAGRTPPDVTAAGEAVELSKRPAGRCQKVLPGVSPPQVTALTTSGRVLVGEVRTYRHPQKGLLCAKLVKPYGSPLHGEMSHLAFTLCGDGNRCKRDWHAYRIDAGPLVVRARSGCVSWRVSMADGARRWLVRSEVRRTGCS